MTYAKSIVARVIATAAGFAKRIAWTGALAMTLLPLVAAAAEPITLKLAFFAPEQTDTFRFGVKPFVDAVNADGKGLLTIKVYPDGVLGKLLAEQPNMVLEGDADIAWVVPGQTPYRFPDNELLEMPGLFRDVREGTFVYTRLVAAKALRGYEDFFVIGAYTSAPSIIHSRTPIGSLADLKSKKIRTNNPMEAETLARLGAIPTIMPAPRLVDALKRGAVDGAIMSPTGLIQFGASKEAANHYLLGIGSAPLLVAMSRKKFDELPEPAQALIRKYSGERAAAIWSESFGASERQSLDKLKAEAGRKTVEPSAADHAAAQRIYHSLVETWAAKSPHNRELLSLVEAELATIRATQR